MRVAGERVLVLACSARRDAVRRAGPVALRVRLPTSGAPTVVEVPRPALEAHLASLLPVGAAPVVDALELDLDLGGATAGGSVLRAVELLRTETERPDGAAACPAARAQLERYVLTLLLRAGRHRFSPGIAEQEDGTRLGRIAPVVAYVDEHADAELTPELLARVACVSVRTLHAAFTERLGVPPMAYVRAVRLAKVRAVLLAADPSEVRVTDVASRWGFYHQSRFAQQYRDRFGELPSATLVR